MKAYLLGGAIAALGLAAAVSAAQPAPPPGVAQGTAPAPLAPPPPAGRTQMRVMIGGDHVMTRQEVAEHVGKLFVKLDTNHDGFITKEEMEAFHQKFAGMADMGREVGERARGMAEMGHEMAMPDRGAMFDRLDTNHDGSISRQEFLAGKPEMRESRTMIIRNSSDGASMAPPVDDHPGMDMEMHMRHMGGMGMGMSGFGGRLFQMADTNHDGKVSLAEAQAAALAHFDKADLNHDGKITPDERQQVHQTLRIERHEG
jgi:Ca2+-binding EF-hand superfamily protein